LLAQRPGRFRPPQKLGEESYCVGISRKTVSAPPAQKLDEESYCVKKTVSAPPPQKLGEESYCGKEGFREPKILSQNFFYHQHPLFLA
jgi:hypothetical protein